MKIEGAVALVTGSNRGIGAAIIEALLASGVARVYAGVRTSNAAARDRVTPITLDVSMKHYRPVEVLGYLEIVERIDSHTIRYSGPDMIAVSNFLVFLLSYDSEATP